MINPYVNRAALRSPDDFFGRAQELQEIYGALQRGLCLVLVGERRVGKSSLLYAVASDPMRDLYKLPPNFRFVHVNAQYFSSSEESEFVEFVLDQCALEFGTVSRGPQLPLLRAAARELTAAGDRMVLMIDEVDVLVHNPRFSPNFFAYLRAWAEEYQLPFLVASLEGSIDFLVASEGAGSPFWNMFRPLYVGPLPEHEALDLVRTPAARLGSPFTEEEVAAILDLGGTQPFFLQIACDHCFRMRQPGSKLDVGALTAAVRAEALPHLRYLTNRLSQPEREAILTVADGGRPDRRILADLLRRGVVVERRGAPRPFSSLLTQVVREEPSPAPGPGTVAARTSHFLFG